MDIKNCQPLLLALNYADTDDEDCKKEREKYLKICKESDIYTYLNDNLVKPYASRDEVKVAVYEKIMYGSKWGMKSRIWRVFEREFPYLAKKIRLKKHYLTSRGFSLNMQKMESRVVIGTVVDFCRVHFPDWIIIPIHDGLLVAKSIVQELKKIFMDSFELRTGIVPVLTIK